MATLTFEATEVKEYKGGVLQNGEYIYMGTKGSSYHDVVIVLDLPRSLEKLTVKHTWYVQVDGGTSYNYGAALTQEELTSAPDVELSYKIPAKEATLTFEKKLKKGRWYLWLWRHNKNAPSYMRGVPGTHPILEITGEASGGVVKVAVGGEVKDAVPMVFLNGAWQETTPTVYRNGTWEEMS